MKVIILGTGTSTGIPEVGCGCPVCQSDDQRDRRLRTSALVITDQGKRILIDCGPDFHEQATRLMLDRVDAVLLTHEHYDHTFGLDDIRTIAWRQEVPIYGQERTLEAVRSRMHYAFGPNPYPGTPRLSLPPIVEGQPFEWQKVDGAQLVVLNALRYSRPHPSHQSVEDVLQRLPQLTERPQLTLLTHLSHHAPSHRELEQLLPSDVRPAYDGQCLSIVDGQVTETPLPPFEQPFHYRDLGRIAYAEAWELQKELFQEQLTLKHEGRPTSSYLLLCEHEPVFTMGKHADKANVLLSPEHLRDMGYDFYEIERGGDVTYHGPGQITGYPILDLERFGLGLRAYIELLESSIIELLRFYGIKGELKEGAAGVWLDVGDPERERKIAAIGVKSSRYVTMHGFALNVTNDLSPFQLINPCGFKQGKVASIAGETGQAIDLVVIRHMLVSILHRRLRELMPQRY